MEIEYSPKCSQVACANPAVCVIWYDIKPKDSQEALLNEVTGHKERDVCIQACVVHRLEMIDYLISKGHILTVG